MKVVLLTVGPLGALRPLLALAVGLREAGYETILGSHENYKEMVEQEGITFSPIAPDSAGLASDHSRDSQFSAAGNPIRYFRALRIEAGELKKAALDVFDRSLDLCKDADLILYHAHMHAASAIAGHLGIPGIQAYNTPVTPTSDFPSYVRLHHSERTSAFSNRLSFLMRDLVTWLPYRGTINQWRHDALALPPLGMTGPYRELDRQHCPLLYSISPSMLKPPEDWPDWVHLTGYWQLEERSEFHPPGDLVKFLEDGPPPVCIGFGSMRYGDVEALTRLVVTAVEQAGQRAILLSGWQGLEETQFPDSIFMCKSIPHHWLFDRVVASVNAGGIGTLTAALRAGLPVLVVPFGGDNLFWGWQATKLGVGPQAIPVKKLSAGLLAERLGELVNNPSYRSAAQRISTSMKTENGVSTAVELVEKYLTTRRNEP